MTNYNHKEAFCLMQYRDRVTGEVETLWNSRDGVTPFVIVSRGGNEAEHINWKQDVCRPNWRPKNGDRIFVDASSEPDVMRKKALSYVEKHWDRMRGNLKNHTGADLTKNEAVQLFFQDWTKDGTPTVIEVQE